jgi:hypothetical protein
VCHARCPALIRAAKGLEFARTARKLARSPQGGARCELFCPPATIVATDDTIPNLAQSMTERAEPQPLRPLILESADGRREFREKALARGQRFQIV